MILTKRDQELLVRLRDYGLLTTSQIASMHFDGVAVTTVLRRLRKLESAFYIQRIRGAETFEAVWSVTEKGATMAGEGAFKRVFRRDVLDHDLKLTSLRLRLEEIGIAQSWIPEHEIRSQVARRHGIREMKNRIVPDGIMGVEVQGFKESIAVELELNFKNSGRYARTLRDYSLKEKIAFVWYVVENPSLGRHLAKLWSANAHPRTGIGFAWSEYSDLIHDPLNAKIQNANKELKLRQLWQSKKSAPAQPPALVVSRGENESEETSSKTTCEKYEQKLAPAS